MSTEGIDKLRLLALAMGVDEDEVPFDLPDLSHLRALHGVQAPEAALEPALKGVEEGAAQLQEQVRKSRERDREIQEEQTEAMEQIKEQTSRDAWYWIKLVLLIIGTVLAVLGLLIKLGWLP